MKKKEDTFAFRFGFIIEQFTDVVGFTEIFTHTETYTLTKSQMEQIKSKIKEVFKENEQIT